METKAAVLYKTNSELVVEKLMIKQPRPGEVLVKIFAAGICHSDLHVISGQAKQELPCVLGHEGAGKVIKLGDGVERVLLGDHVVLNWSPYCDNCLQCKRGRSHLCQSHQTAINGGTLLDGSCRLYNSDGSEVNQLGTLGCWSEYVVVPQECCVSIDKAVRFDVAALLGCAVTTGVGAIINKAKVNVGDTVVIIGMGGVGLSLVMGAKYRGASKIICIDVNPRVQKLATSLGCSDFILADAGTNIADRIRELTQIGADHVFEAVGKSTLQEAAIDYCCPGGHVTFVGLDSPDAVILLPTTKITRSEKTVTGSIYGSSYPDRDFVFYSEEFLARSLPIDRMIKRYYPLDKINESIQDLLLGEPGRGIISFD